MSLLNWVYCRNEYELANVVKAVHELGRSTDVVVTVGLDGELDYQVHVPRRIARRLAVRDAIRRIKEGAS